MPIASADAPEAGGDFHLQFSSPGINAGDNAVVSSPPFPGDGMGNPLDLEGNPRIAVADVDMGVYELACEAGAGQLTNSLSSPTLFICKAADAQFTFAVTGQASGPGYAFAFLLVNDSGQILETSPDGDFALEALPNGTYTVYGLSYAVFNDPANIQDYLLGKSLADVQSDDDSDPFCLDLTNTPQSGHSSHITVERSGCGGFPWGGN